MSEYGLRLEDYGRQVMSTLPKLSKEKIADGFTNYLKDLGHIKYFMILSNKIGYYNVFKAESLDIKDKVENILLFLQNSRYYNVDTEEEPYVEMNNIKHYEINEDHGHLELWIGKEYFQFFPFDWGVEKI